MESERGRRRFSLVIGRAKMEVECRQPTALVFAAYLLAHNIYYFLPQS